MVKRYETLESIRQRTLMSKELVARKDKEYGWYAGASWEIASKMAKVDTMLKMGIFPKQLIPFIKLYRAYLDQQRKAWFASMSTEITKLGLMLGLKDDSISAT